MSNGTDGSSSPPQDGSRWATGHPEDTLDGRSDPVEAGSHSPGSQELVPEEAVDVDDLGSTTQVDQGEATPIPEEIHALTEALDAANYPWEYVRPAPLAPPQQVARLKFDLPAGRSSRPIVVDAADAARILTGDIANWRSLERHEGIWSRRDGVVEVAIRPDRMPAAYVTRRIAEALEKETFVGETNPSAVEIVDPESGIHLRIGESSPFSAPLCAGSRLLRTRSPMTFRIWPVAIETTEEADSIVELATDSVSIDFGMLIGVSVIPRRLETRMIARHGATRRSGRLTFPRNRYPHAPATLFQAGKDHRTSPLIRYWCFYQVLEYFFPAHSQAEAVRQLSRHLRSPKFDAHNDEDVLRAVQLAGNAGRSNGSEEEQLRVALLAVVSPEELLEFLREARLEDQLADRKSGLSSHAININSGDLHLQLSRRIYDIRCRIVHSKSGRTPGEGAGLLPGTHHDDLIRDELVLLEFLAQQALVAAADRLLLARR